MTLAPHAWRWLGLAALLLASEGFADHMNGQYRGTGQVAGGGMLELYQRGTFLEGRIFVGAGPGFLQGQTDGRDNAKGTVDFQTGERFFFEARWEPRGMTIGLMPADARGGPDHRHTTTYYFARQDGPAVGPDRPVPTVPAPSAPQQGTATPPPPDTRAHRREPAHQPGRLPTGFRRFTRGTGEVIIGRKPGIRSASDELAGITRLFSNYFDRRPTITGGFRLKNDQEAHILFGAVFKGQPVMGVMRSSLDSAGTGTSGIVFDRADAPPGAIDALMAMLDEASGRGRSVRGPTPGIIRPQEVQWHVAPFPDGSGQIRLPQGFRITSSYQGAVDIVGPQGEDMQLGHGYPVAMPESVISPLTGMPMQGSLVAPAGLDPVNALTTIVPQLIVMARQVDPRTPGKRITRIIEWAPVQSAGGGRAGLILWEFQLDGRAYRALTLVDVSPPAAGWWVYYTSGVAAPRERFDQVLPIMMYAWQNGWKIDARVFQERLNHAYRTMKETHRIMTQTMQETSQRTHDKLYDWSEVVRGQRIVRDRTTGWEFTTDIGWSKQTVDTLNRREGWDKYEEIRLRDWWQGR